MKVELEIQEKPKEDILSRKGNNPDDIYNLDEVQSIKNAIKNDIKIVNETNNSSEEIINEYFSELIS